MWNDSRISGCLVGAVGIEPTSHVGWNAGVESPTYPNVRAFGFVREI